MKHEPRVERKCEQCGKRFTVYAHILRDKPCKFCSRQCYFANKAARHRAVVCPTCGKRFVVETLEAEKSKHGPFCSRWCYGRWRSANMTGANSPSWRGGKAVYSYYRGSWKRQRQRAKQRDEFACQACGKQSPRRSRNLDVHHIVPYSPTQNPVVAHDLSNLTTLCRACHSALHQAM